LLSREYLLLSSINSLLPKVINWLVLFDFSNNRIAISNWWTSRKIVFKVNSIRLQSFQSELTRHSVSKRILG